MADFEQYFEQYSQSGTSGALLKRRSLQSGLITVAAQPFKLVIGIGATAVLARLVTPADFGLVAMVMPLLSFGDSLSNFGLESATVQQPSLNHEQASSAFWFSLKVNAAVIAAMVLMGPVLAKFYNQPSLTLLTLAMSVGFFSLCLSFQHKALLKRQMKFELLTAIELGAIAIATAAAIVAAWLGLGYWALMLQVVVMQVVQGIAYWLTCRWRPARLKGASIGSRPEYSAKYSTQAMLSYGAHLTGFRFLTRIGMQLDRILVGYISGATALGFYDVAYRWAAFPFMQVYFSLFDVAVASFSRAYGDKNAYRQYCRWGIMPLFAICMPALAFLYVAAEEVLLVLLGNQWLAAVPIFRLLAIAMFVSSAHRVTKWLYMSSGQTQRQLRWGLIHTPLLIIAVCIGATQGAYGIAMGYTLGTCALTYPSVAYCLKRSPLTTADFWGTVWRPAVASILSALCLFWSQPVVSSISNLFLRLSIEAIEFSSFYVLFWLLLPGGKRSVAEIVGHLKFLRSKTGD